MNFEYYLENQIKLHPDMKAQDIVKLCYQAARGGEHLLTDTEGAKKFLYQEFSNTQPCNMPVYEEISDRFCRVNIAAWKQRGWSVDRLFEIFVLSAEQANAYTDMLCEFLKRAEMVVTAGKAPVSPDEWKEYVDGYKKAGMPSVHHSEQYRKHEKPSYRVVLTHLVKDESCL